MRIAVECIDGMEVILHTVSAYLIIILITHISPQLIEYSSYHTHETISIEFQTTALPSPPHIKPYSTINAGRYISKYNVGR